MMGAVRIGMGVMGVLSMLVTLTRAQEQTETAENLEREYATALAKSGNDLIEFQLMYIDGLKRAEAKAQEEGDLEQVIAFKNERKNYLEVKERDYSAFPDLERIREIYDGRIDELQQAGDAAKAKIQQQYLPRFEALIRTLTQAGDLDGALGLSEKKSEMEADLAEWKRLTKAAEKEAGLIDNVVWEFRSRASVERIRDCEVNSSDEGFRLEKGRNVAWVEAKKKMRPPFRIDAIAATDSTNIRIYYNDETMLIFNWEVNESELRFHDPAIGRKFGMKGLGAISKGEFHHFEIDVLTEKILVKVDGEPRAELAGAFGDVNARVGIGHGFGSVVTVKEMKLIELD